jgi:hypothetical protein
VSAAQAVGRAARGKPFRPAAFDLAEAERCKPAPQRRQVEIGAQEP